MADEMIEDKNAKTYFRHDETQSEMSEDERERSANEALALVIPGYQPTHIKRDDEIDWANGGKTVVDHRKPAPTAAPTATPAPTPAKPSLDNGDTIVKDGRGVTQFGSKIRIVDQKTGATRWTDLNGNPVEEPKSEQMRRMMADGHTSLGVQSAGFKSWDEALAAQRGGEQAEALAKSRAYGAQLLERQNYDNEQMKKRLTNRRLAAGDAFGAALSGLNGEIARTEDGKIIGKDGKPVDRRVRVSSDGKHIYLMSSVSPSALKAANDQRRKNGGASDYNSIVAYREIDVNGNPLKDKDGNDIPPMIAVRDTPGGQSGTDVKQRFRTMSLRDVSDKILQAHRDAGHGDDDTIKTATVEQLGGWDPNGWFSGRAETVRAIGKGGGRGSGESGTRPTTGTPSARDMNAIAGTIERIGGMSPDMFEGGASEQKAFIKHLMQQTGFQFDGSAGGGGGGGLAVQPKNGSGAATVETGDETTPAPTGGTQQGAKPTKKYTKEEIAAAKAERARRAADRDWGATTLADGYTLGDEQQSEDEEGVSFRPVLDKDGNNVGAIFSDGFRSQLGEDGQYAEVPDDADASWQDEGRTTDELRRRFAEGKGIVNEDGSFSINGDEYLSDDERAELGDGSSEGITRKLVRAQTQIAKRRAEVAQKRKTKGELLKLDARKKFRGNKQKQEEWVERMLTAWDEKNDPSSRRKAEAAAERRDFDWAHGHGMR